jgi:ABC-type polysaccharide/polyol phosphate export permease
MATKTHWTEQVLVGFSTVALVLGLLCACIALVLGAGFIVWNRMGMAMMLGGLLTAYIRFTRHKSGCSVMSWRGALWHYVPQLTGMMVALTLALTAMNPAVWQPDYQPEMLVIAVAIGALASFIVVLRSVLSFDREFGAGELSGIGRWALLCFATGFALLCYTSVP